MAKGWKGYAHKRKKWVTEIANYEADYTEPVWVTPLIEGEPQIGERWGYRGSTHGYEVLAAPVGVDGVRYVMVKGTDPFTVRVDRLTPLPEKKRYRVSGLQQDGHVRGFTLEVEATDRDDLRERLAALADDAEVVGMTACSGLCGGYPDKPCRCHEIRRADR